jgi:hypothetical protein
MAGTNWRTEAKCANHSELDFFDLDCGLQESLALCKRCTVQTQCLNVAIDHRYIEGIWGGLYGKPLYAAVTARRNQRWADA